MKSKMSLLLSACSWFHVIHHRMLYQCKKKNLYISVKIMEKGNLMLFFKANLHLLSSIPTCKTNLDSQFLMDKINYNPIIFLFLLSNVLKKKRPKMG